MPPEAGCSYMPVVCTNLKRGPAHCSCHMWRSSNAHLCSDNSESESPPGAGGTQRPTIGHACQGELELVVRPLHLAIWSPPRTIGCMRPLTACMTELASSSASPCAAASERPEIQDGDRMETGRRRDGDGMETGRTRDRDGMETGRRREWRMEMGWACTQGIMFELAWSAREPDCLWHMHVHLLLPPHTPT